MAQTGKFWFPPEWAPQSGIWLAWPTFDSVDGRPIAQVHSDIVLETMGTSRINILVNDEEQKKLALTTIKNRIGARKRGEEEGEGVEFVEEGVEKGEREVKEVVEEEGEGGEEMAMVKEWVSFYFVEHDDIWMRDFGPIFAFDDSGKPCVLQFIWTEWGYALYSTPAKNNNSEISSLVGKALNLPVININYCSEGGDRDYCGGDGEEKGKGGILLASSVVETNRNPKSTVEEMEKRLKDTFKIEHILWTKDGLADDGLTYQSPIADTDIFTCFGTGGHIDEYARFANDKTLLLAYIAPEERNEKLGQMSHKNMEENLDLIEKQLKDMKREYEILRVPCPPSLIWEISGNSELGEAIKGVSKGAKDKEKMKIVLATSYLNFLITNDIILMPKYYKKGRSLRFKETDEEAKEVLQKAFPKHKICQIFTENVNSGGGGIHCISQQMPKF